MRTIISRIEEFENKEDDINEHIRDTLEKINTEKYELIEIDRKIENYKENIKGESQKEKELKELESSLEEKENQYNKLQIEIENLESTLISLEKQLGTLENEFAVLLKKSAENEYEAKRLELIQTVNIKLKDMFEEYSNDTRLILGEETTRIFRRLIDDKDMSLINEIKVNNRYEL